VSGGSLEAAIQLYWFAEADEGSDDAPCRLSIGPNGLPNRGWVEQCAPIGHG